MPDTPTLAPLAVIAVALLRSESASGTSLRERVYRSHFERLYKKNKMEPTQMALPCGSGSESLWYFDSGPPRSGGGSTRPILLLHGFTGDKRSWLGMVEPLARRHRVIGVDLAGHGGSSDAVDDDYSFERQAERAHRLLTNLPDEVSRYHVLGHSMGGAVAIALASEHPEAVLSLGLIAAAGARGQHTDDVMKLIRERSRPGRPFNPLIVGEDWNGLARLRFVANLPWYSRAILRFVNRPMTDEALPRKKHYDRIFEKLADRETNHPLTCTDLDRSRPTFYLYGTKDRVLEPVWARCFSEESPPSWTLARLAGAGHSPNVQRPKQVAAIYLAFLDGVGEDV